ncbi:MAG: hypothetical protein J0I06_02985 [Planctomycetes bacterium]|nr:hypothetical protein [Planctomycetota bacterium]
MPRSPSRDLSDPHDGGRGYFHRPGGITRAKLALAAVGLALVFGWAAVDAGYPSRAATAHSPGPLASPHAAWDANCAACHVGFSVTDFGPVSVFRAGERWHAVTCEKCHAGPAHHSTVDAEGAAFHARCANCHHDHDGRQNALARVADAQCVRCHENLSAHHANGGGPVGATVTAFSRDHPEFRLLAAHAGSPSYDKRTLKFSHALHMTPGLTYREGAKGTWTLERLAELSGEAVAKRYQMPWQSPGSPVTLDCASCHSLDAAGPGSRSAPRTDGAYYQPVSFEAHCKTCHPVRAPAGVSGTVAVPAFDLPHGVQPSELVERIAGEYSRHLLDDRNRFASTPLGPVGRFDARSNPALATYKSEIQRLAATATSVLMAPAPSPAANEPPVPARGAACAKCHDLAPSAANAALPTIAPVATPAVWLSGARFNHSTHRGVSCASCHPGTGAAFFGTGWTAEKEPVRIAGVGSCQQCHGPLRTVTGADGTRREIGGAKHACTDCHKYHNGDHPQQGRGARDRNPGRRFDASEFFRGP